MQNSTSHQQWLGTPYAEHFLNIERAFTDRALRQLGGPNVLLLGNFLQADSLYDLDFPNLVKVAECSENSNHAHCLAADNAFLPFSEGSFASVLAPHVLESHELPHQVLREAHRVLQPDGHLLLTCMNPASLIGAQRFCRMGAAPKGQYYPLSRTKDWLHLLGFEVVGSAMYHYAPLAKRPLLTRRFAFLNAIGDRWLPMLGGSYLISARKREVGMRMVGKLRFASARGTSMSPAPAGSASTGQQRATSGRGLTEHNK